MTIPELPRHPRRPAPAGPDGDPGGRAHGAARVSIVNVALPSIEREFGVSAGTVQWVVSGYALTFGLALVPAGRLGDTIGRRRMFLIALSAFVVTSGLTGAAQTTGWLLAARLLQGVAGGMLIPQNVGLVQPCSAGRSGPGPSASSAAWSDWPPPPARWSAV